MGTSSNLISLYVYRCELLESRAQIVIQSETTMLPSPRVLTNAHSTGTSLVLDELQAELIFAEHILDVQKPRQGAPSRQRHVSPCASKDEAVCEAFPVLNVMHL